MDQVISATKINELVNNMEPDTSIESLRFIISKEDMIGTKV